MDKSILNYPMLLSAFLWMTAGCVMESDKTGNDNLAGENWSEYNGNGERNHYSSLDQINRENLHRLSVAWEYSSGGADTVNNRSQMQCNPLIIDGVLYGVSAGTQVFALDAATGKEKWKTNIRDNAGTTSRGVTWFSAGDSGRLFFGAGKYLYAIDAANGNLIHSFGDSGRIDLKKALVRPGGDDYISSNTPNTVYKNLIITGVRLAESETALLGDIIAYDVYSGDLVWRFRTIPEKGDFGYETWPENPREHFGGANAWPGMSIDRNRGIVYAATGSAAFDFWGGNRKGDNLFANCLIALDAATGRRLWHFQLVHHDVWDRDPPAPPNLLTINKDGRKRDVVAQITKQGHIYVFDRVTGEPVFPIEEKAVAQDGIAGEFLAPTQPFPVKPVPFTRQSFMEKDINAWVSNRDSLVQLLKRARTGSAYIPITGDMTLFFPGTDGGAQWGGAATDPDGMMYIPAKEIPVYTTLIPAEDGKNASATGATLYQRYCASCHGADMKGSHDGSYPALAGLEKRMNLPAVQKILLEGRGRMSSFSHLPVEQRTAIVDFLLSGKELSVKINDSTDPYKVPFRHTGYNRWYDRMGFPVSEPPWGTLTAININTGELKWQVPLGEYPELIKNGIRPTGTDNYGGPLVTASGLIFIAASRDEKFRVFDKNDGRILWETKLPAAGYASPSTYSVKGKQYVVIACGGGKLNTKSGDKYVAFSIKD